MQKYRINFARKQGSRDVIHIFAVSMAAARKIFEANFGPHPEARITHIGPAAPEEIREINNTGAPHPRH